MVFLLQEVVAAVDIILTYQDLLEDLVVEEVQLHLFLLNLMEMLDLIVVYQEQEFQLLLQ